LKKLLFSILCMGCVVFAFSQGKPRLGILPFSGSVGGDGETIAELFSFQPDIQGAFTVVPRTSAVNALVAEQNFQLSGYTDSDTIARLGRLLNADFVVSGHIRRLGSRNLVITTIINVESFELLAGDYREYRRNIEEVRGMLPEIARKMITASQRDTSKLPKLAVAPFNSAKGATQDGETLAQILAVEISNTGKYAVLPRTTTLQAALKELQYQMSGYTAEEEAKRLGAAINAKYILSAQLRRLGSQNMFTGQILHVEDGSLLAGESRDYRTIGDGITLMGELALLLAYREGAKTLIAARNRAAFFADPARLWSLGVSAGTSFTDPLAIVTVRGTIAPLRYSFLELGCDAGFISDVEGARYYSVYPFIHYALFVPFPRKGGWYMGAGAGYMIADYQIEDITVSREILAADITTGVNILNFLDISYTLRTDLDSANHKISVGFCYRFR